MSLYRAFAALLMLPALALPAPFRGQDSQPEDTRADHVRERVAREPEQTYERAVREIPPLDTERLYLPLAADASGQKFILHWDGRVEAGGVLWSLGTGDREVRGRWLSVMEDDLPIPASRWNSGGFEHEQETFVTLLEGPLGPEARDERIPAVLLTRLSAANRKAATETARFRISLQGAGPLALEGNVLSTEPGEALRGLLLIPEGAAATLGPNNEVHVRAQVAAGRETSLNLAIPYYPYLSEPQRQRLRELDYARERRRVADYWREAAGSAVPFQVPELRFNSFARAALAHVRMSATKEPATGLYVPAGGYEATAQVQLLDVLGQHDLARRYLHGLLVQNAVPGAAESGMLLWAMADHFFYTRDHAWLESVKGEMERAALRLSADRPVTGDAQGRPDFLAGAWAAGGLRAFVQALQASGDPDAEWHRRQAEAFGADLRAAVLQTGSVLPGSPGELVYSPLALLEAGVFGPLEPVASRILDYWEDNVSWRGEDGWFSRSGMAARPHLLSPIRTYLQRGETRAAIRALYNGFVATNYPGPNVLAREFEPLGISRGPFYSPDEARFVHRLRDLLVMDFGGDLYLAPGAPQNWLRSGKGIQVLNAPSRFGPVTFLLRAVEDEVRATVVLPVRSPYGNAWIRAGASGGGRIGAVFINGKRWFDFDARTGNIRLPRLRGKLELLVKLRTPIIEIAAEDAKSS
jgi:hypothetical protein